MACLEVFAKTYQGTWPTPNQNRRDIDWVGSQSSHWMDRYSCRNRQKRIVDTDCRNGGAYSLANLGLGEYGIWAIIFFIPHTSTCSILQNFIIWQSNLSIKIMWWIERKFDSTNRQISIPRPHWAKKNLRRPAQRILDVPLFSSFQILLQIWWLHMVLCMLFIRFW